MDIWDALINGRILPVVVAPAIGSFCGVLVRRLPAGGNVLTGRSACEACGHVLRPAEMVPVASFLALRGRCAACGAPIAREHLAIELAALAIAGVAVLLVPGGPYLWVSCLLGWWLLTLGWIDARTFRLPDVLTLPLILAGLGEAAWLEPASLTLRAAAAAGCFALLYLLSVTYRRLRGRDGLGLGDAKLLAAGGAWAGPTALPFLLFSAAVLALLYVLALRLAGTRLTAAAKIPFGPFIAMAIWLAWLLRP